MQTWDFPSYGLEQSMPLHGHKKPKSQATLFGSQAVKILFLYRLLWKKANGAFETFS